MSVIQIQHADGRLIDSVSVSFEPVVRAALQGHTRPARFADLGERERLEVTSRVTASVGARDYTFEAGQLVVFPLPLQGG